MPRKKGLKRSNKRSGGRRGGSNGGGGSTTRLAFNDIWAETFTASATIRNYQVTASNGGFTRASTMGAMFVYYRFTKLRATILPTISGTNCLALSYVPDLTGVSDVSTFGAVVEQIPSITYSLIQTVPVSMNVSKKVLLKNPTKWFAYNQNSTDVPPFQGKFHLIPVSSLTATIYIRLTGVVEFSSASPATGADLAKVFIGPQFRTNKNLTPTITSDEYLFLVSLLPLLDDDDRFPMLERLRFSSTISEEDFLKKFLEESTTCLHVTVCNKMIKDRLETLSSRK